MGSWGGEGSLKARLFFRTACSELHFQNCTSKVLENCLKNLNRFKEVRKGLNGFKRVLNDFKSSLKGFGRG